MAARLPWWFLPAACVVLARVVTLQSGPDAVAPAVAPGASPLAETGALGPVVLREASAARRKAAVLPGCTLVVRLPERTHGARVALALERVGPDGERSPWLQGTPRVPADGALHFVGLPAGVYALSASWGDGDEACSRSCERVEVPGTVDLSR